MMLGEVVSTIGFALAPVDLKLALAHSIANPIKTHVDRFGAFLFNGVSDDATGGVVVCRHWSSGLGMAHFGVGDA
jgi:hypothetical protein